MQREASNADGGSHFAARRQAESAIGDCLCWPLVLKSIGASTHLILALETARRASVYGAS